MKGEKENLYYSHYSDSVFLSFFSFVSVNKEAVLP